ncbi:MAG TPA: CRISPR-associated helicase Cas3' [Firmicutes bacterium]|nr:CRISPR-associated helicase Cas3' [Bacillota bacterium]
MTYYAHSRENASEKEWQPLVTHLQNTAKLAARFADKFCAGHFGYVLGLLHDIGKYSEEFQRRLKGCMIRVDHSTSGAQQAVKLYGTAVGRLLAYAIAGHHSGLPDYGSPADTDSLCRRLTKDVPSLSNDFQEVLADVPSDLPLPIHLATNPGFSIQFFIRLLYSCLVDADFLDTESFMQADKARIRERQYRSIPELLTALDSHLEGITKKARPTNVNRLRGQILDACRKKAEQPPGLFTLTVPTGGGKTLSSLAFALKHAFLHGMDRVIYVIPFTSIIEQNADVFRQAVGEDCVLEHHSNYQFSMLDEEEAANDQFYRLMLSTENWDAPIVVTTNVQFFESLFASRSSRCRKLHNIANSVVILDEAQMLPTHYLRPCVLSLVELVRNYHVTVVLCTATQPALSGLIPDEIVVSEIIPDPIHLYEALRRVQVQKMDTVNDEELANAILQHHQALCIVNTRDHAQRLFERIKGPGAFHLSARMYPAHRAQKLDEIREALRSRKECRVISTQLIEAGVDVDFPVVYRSISGIDSIAQAAGRCNREGRREKGDIYVFRPEQHGLPRGWFSRTAAIADIVMRDHEDPLSLEAVKQYFELLYDIERERLDKKGIVRIFEEGARQLAFPFATVAGEFQIIENDMVSIIIPRNQECEVLLEEARWRGPSRQLSRMLQRYTISIYRNEYAELVQRGALEAVAEQYLVLREPAFYSEETGFSIPEFSLDMDLIF